ncbi:MAG: hypothetical protein AAF581_09300 [Planctomycetota bacterium]
MRALRALVLSLVVCAAAVAHADFTYTNMANPAGLNLVSDAVHWNNHIKMTMATASEKGAVWRAAKETVASGFTTTFTLEFVATSGGADGMAFVIQNSSATAIGDHAGALGYGGFLNSPQNGIPNSVAIEFDDFANGNMNDPNGNHISVHSEGANPNSPHENSSLGSVAVPPLPGPHMFEIVYDGTNLSITMDGAAAPNLVVALDLQALIGGTDAWVGFTASTGGLFEEHRLWAWSFQSGGGGSQQFERGDVDASGTINLQDAIIALGVLFPQGTPMALMCEAATDVNDDDAHNLADVIVLLSYLFVGGSPPPEPPLGACGVDPTPGSLTCDTFPPCP